MDAYIWFKLGENKIGDRGVAAIQKGHWKQIKKIGLGGNEISVMGVRSTAPS